VNEALALKVLDKVMSWNTERATKEFHWLRLISNFKYDSYRDYFAGVRFIETLADWLQQFKPNERETAYEFVRNHIVFISALEIQHLAQRMYPQIIHPHLVRLAAQEIGIKPYLLWSHPKGEQTYEILKRKTLFVAASDGARIDTFRRANAGQISNEQVLVAPQTNEEKWNAVLKDLRKDLSDETAVFAAVFLIDDFVATGTTMLRKDGAGWKGKLVRFWEETSEKASTHFVPDWQLHVHHYIGTTRARNDLKTRNAEISADKGSGKWFRTTNFTFGTVLPVDLPLERSKHSDFFKLIDKYYDPSIESKHTELGGKDVRLGFGGCALPLILEHNTPNNSIALLWADTPGDDTVLGMRPLFRRRQRHL
jgi:hypothetical protein